MSKITLKHRARLLFRKFGLDVQPYQKQFADAPIQMSNVLALTISDLLFRQIPENKLPSDCTVIQIGANDGKSFDPVRSFILKYKFRALLVEPQPDVFERLKKNYEGREGVSFANVAISAKRGVLPLYRFKKTADQSEWADCLASFSKETLLNNFHNVRGEVEELPIEAITLDDLFVKSGFEQVDLLQIDTEGYDYEILKMLETSSMRPTIINFEHGFLSQDQQYECFAYLNRLGYKVTNNGPDTIAYLEPEEQSLFRIDIQAE